MRLDEASAREVAQRDGINSVVVVAIDRVDSSYMLSARIIDAATGATLAAETHVAKGRSEVIAGLDDLVRRLRRDIGESAGAIAKHDLPLPQATTGSCRPCANTPTASRRGEAVIAGGGRALRGGGRDRFRFALAHADLGVAYYVTTTVDGDKHFDPRFANWTGSPIASA
jgi:hypothetical protein